MKNVIERLLVAVLTIGASITLFSCSATSRPLIRTTNTIDITGKVMFLPIIVDLDVIETRISGSAARQFKGRTARESDIELVKQLALTNAIFTSKSDTLIEPVYVIEVVSLSQEGVTFEPRYEVRVSVSGFPGNYSNFRVINEEDINLLQKSSILTP
jgi:hypothetical protein